jgi:light-regulated signal transduction histidine kinase (bacteriophytochrome)
MFAEFLLIHAAEALRDLQKAAGVLPDQILSSVRTIHDITELLLRVPSLDASLREYIQMVKLPSAFLSNLAQDLLTYCKLVGQQVSLEQVEFDLYRTIEEINTQHGNLVTPYIGVEVPRVVCGDPGCLKQVRALLLAISMHNTLSFPQ